MKAKFIIAILLAFIGLNVSAQNNFVAKDTLQKCKLFHHKASKKKIEAAGPFKASPSSTPIEIKSGDEKNIYHNEQDNFKRPDSIPYRPAPTKSDTSNDHSYFEHNVDEYPSAFKTTQANPAVNFGFDANWCGNNTPPDNALAVSNGGYVVSAINCRLDIYNTSGTWLSNIDYQTFFGATSNNFSDPKLVYDMYSNKFIFFIQYGCDASTSRIYIAFSTSSDPTQSWNYYWFDIGTSGGLFPNNWFDYPSVGINQTDFCVTGNIFSGSGCTGSASFASNVLLLINKQDGYNGVSGANLHWLYWTDVTDGSSNTGFTIVPATAGQNITYSNVFYLVSTLSGGGSYLTKYTLSGNASNSNSTISATNIYTSQTYYPNNTATQPSGISLANTKAGCRIQSAIYLNNTISFVYTGNYNDGSYDYNSIYTNRINVSSNSLNQNWSYLSGSNYNYPSIASFGNSSADVASMLCFLKSDNSTYPEIRFKYFDNAMNQLASSQARQGDASVYYSFASPSQRWGDYTATQRRYSSSQPEAWISGSFGNSSNNWQTHIAQITGYPGNVSVAEINLNDENLIVYPNPVLSQLYIKGDFKNTHYFPELYSIDGKLLNIDVTRKDNEMFQVDVSWLPKGTYLIKFQNSQTIKFIKE